MFLVLMILGLALWWGAHMIKPMKPALRAELAAKHGEKKVRGLIALALLASVVMMGLGYAYAPWIDIWYPPLWLKGINNLLMFPALALMAAGDMKSNLARVTRHPQLAGFKLWAVLHLAVNGDLASVILFGGLLAWGVVTMIALNKRDGAWVKPDPRPRKNDVKLAVATVVMYGVIVGIHFLGGVNPFS